MATKFFDKTKIAKKEFYGAKKPMKIWDVDVGNVVKILNLIKMKNNSKYLIRYLGDVIRPLVMVLPKMSGYIKTFKDKDKNKNNQLMFFRIDNDKLIEKYKTIWTKIEDMQNIELNALPVYDDDRYIKTKIKINCDKFYTNVCGLNVQEDGVGWESITIISIHYFLVYENKYYLQVKAPTILGRVA